MGAYRPNVTEKEAAKIRALLAAGLSHTTCAQRFGIDRKTVWNIANGVTRKKP